MTITFTWGGLLLWGLAGIGAVVVLYFLFGIIFLLLFFR